MSKNTIIATNTSSLSITKIIDMTHNTTLQAQVAKLNGAPAVKVTTPPSKNPGNSDSLPMFIDDSSTAINIGDSVVPEAVMNGVAKLPGQLQDIGVKLIGIHTQKDGTNWRLVTSEGWQIVVDPTADLSAQVENLNQVLVNAIKGQRPHLQYVDVRFGNRVYYK